MRGRFGFAATLALNASRNLARFHRNAGRCPLRSVTRVSASLLLPEVRIRTARDMRRAMSQEHPLTKAFWKHKKSKISQLSGPVVVSQLHA